MCSLLPLWTIRLGLKLTNRKGYTFFQSPWGIVAGAILARTLLKPVINKKWQPKIDGLILLAEGRAGKPEGDLAKEKLRRILRRFPELAQRHAPLDEFANRVFTMRDLGQMKRQGISTDGAWSGRNLNEATNMMVADYKRRLWERKPPLQKIAILERELGNLAPLALE